MPVEHVESASGFAAFVYSAADGRPTAAMPAAAAAAPKSAARRGLALSDPNKRPCPTPEVAGARRKRAAPTCDGSGRGHRVVTAARPQSTPSSFAVRRGNSGPSSAQPNEEPIDLTNTSSSSEDGAEDTAEPTLSAATPPADAAVQLKRATAETDEARRKEKVKQLLNDELTREVKKLMQVIETLKGNAVATEAGSSQLQADGAAASTRIVALETQLAEAATARMALVGAFGAGGCSQLQAFVRHLGQRLAEVIRIAVPDDATLATPHGVIACAEQLAAGLASLIAQQQEVAAAATREATEERRAREQGDAALVRAGQAAEVTASANMGSQLAQLEAEKGRQAWEMQQAMDAMKDEYERKFAEQRGEIVCLERQLSNWNVQHQHQQMYMAPPPTASKPYIPRRSVEMTAATPLGPPIHAGRGSSGPPRSSTDHTSASAPRSSTSLEMSTSNDTSNEISTTDADDGPALTLEPETASEPPQPAATAAKPATAQKPAAASRPAAPGGARPPPPPPLPPASYKPAPKTAIQPATAGSGSAAPAAKPPAAQGLMLEIENAPKLKKTAGAGVRPQAAASGPEFLSAITPGKILKLKKTGARTPGGGLGTVSKNTAPPAATAPGALAIDTDFVAGLKKRFNHMRTPATERSDFGDETDHSPGSDFSDSE